MPVRAEVEPGRASLLDDGGRPGERLQAAGASAPAARTADLDADVPDLTGIAVRALVDVAVEPQAGTDALAHEQRGHHRDVVAGGEAGAGGGRGRVVLEQ